jgi:hypothetical protein
VTSLLYITAENCHFCEHGRAVLDELGVERRIHGENGSRRTSTPAPN